MSSSIVVTRLQSVIVDSGKPQLLVKVKLKPASSEGLSDEEAVSIPLLALIDTGATKTAICESVLNRIKAERHSLSKMRSSSGKEDKRYLRFVTLDLLDNDNVVFYDANSVRKGEAPANSRDPAVIRSRCLAHKKYRLCSLKWIGGF